VFSLAGAIGRHRGDAGARGADLARIEEAVFRPPVIFFLPRGDSARATGWS
jgi:hypothetical protein